MKFVIKSLPLSGGRESNHARNTKVGDSTRGTGSSVPRMHANPLCGAGRLVEYTTCTVFRSESKRSNRSLLVQNEPAHANPSGIASILKCRSRLVYEANQFYRVHCLRGRAAGG
ncbi:hypothetical protein EVAR_94066_1 [Eumeta japonica]|uniref:Uncharacterized protein n=1 Tax=Eumeta variegata TaxID=151549 RepID=A0A4C1V5E7_EUMVA|nr:hypothetical protein EVAR_94066_1 [Eumeta japonica]